MNKIEVPSQQLKDERIRLLKRKIRPDCMFVLLHGPSSTGKSTIIREMNALADNFSYDYVRPIMTRPNREGEVDKISVDDTDFDTMQSQGAFVVVNSLYAVRYGTPIAGILQPLADGNVPILDYPLSTVESLRRPDYDLLHVYIYPPSIESWRERMEATGRNVNGRLEQGMQELAALAMGNYAHPSIDLSVVNHDGAQQEAAAQIHQTVLTIRSAC
jgi:guanylate kinase